MHVEFVGLPGCGKSTLASALEKRLLAEGFQVQGLRNAAKAAIAEVKDKVGFLRQRGERISLYGCFLFAHKNPELFEWMFRMSHKDFAALSWGMEALSQYGIVHEHGDPDHIILNDEGFLQRFSWNFMEMGDRSQAEMVSDLLPDDFLTVHMTLTPEDAYRRAKGRKKGVPSALKSADPAASVAKFASYGAALDWFVAARQERGCVVIEVDARAEPDAVIDEALMVLRANLPVLGPVSKPKRRKAMT